MEYKRDAKYVLNFVSIAVGQNVRRFRGEKNVYSEHRSVPQLSSRFLSSFAMRRNLQGIDTVFEVYRAVTGAFGAETG